MNAFKLNKPLKQSRISYTWAVLVAFKERSTRTHLVDLYFLTSPSIYLFTFTTHRSVQPQFYPPGTCLIPSCLITFSSPISRISFNPYRELTLFASNPTQLNRREGEPRRLPRYALYLPTYQAIINKPYWILLCHLATRGPPASSTWRRDQPPLPLSLSLSVPAPAPAQVRHRRGGVSGGGGGQPAGRLLPSSLPPLTYLRRVSSELSCLSSERPSALLRSLLSSSAARQCSACDSPPG